MKKWFLVPLFLILAAVMIFTSCGGGETTQATQPTTTQPTTTTPAAPAEPYGTITAANADFGWESMDPVYYETFWGWAFYDAFIRYDEEGNFVPCVAESWTIDENVFTFKIRQGIKFHNGDPLTAHDVKFSIDRFGDMSLSTNPWSYYLSTLYNKIETIVVDDYTFQFVSARPEPAQMIIFAWTRILPKNYYESVGMEEFRKNPIGSGPWKFVELIPETSCKLEANTEYWNPDEIPHYQYYVDLQVPEEATRIAMLQRGEVDIAYGITYDRLAELRDEGFGTVVVGFPSLSNYTYQGTWLPDAGPTGDIRVRKAMSYALNRQEICDTWFAGLAKPGGTWFMHEGSFGWTDALGQMDPFDPAMAASLLAEAGYPEAFEDPTIHFYTTPAGQDYLLLLVDYWQDAGIDVQIEVVDSTVNGAYFFNFTRLVEGDPNVGWMFGWGFGSTFNSIYHCSNMYCSWGTHNSGNDPVLDELYLKAANETDPELQRQYWEEFQVYAKSQYINVGVATIDSLVLVNPDTLGAWTGRNWVSVMDCMNGILHP